MPKALWLTLVFLTHTFGASYAFADVPNGFAETQIAGGLSSPTAMAIAPDGRIFVCEQGGRLRVVKNGVLLTSSFLSLPVDSNGERGLLGVAFDPNFITNQFVYVYYTATTPNVHNRLSRFRANGDVAVAGSETVLADLDPLSGATNHNGGAIHFGQDGKLYVAVGDNANSDVAQSLTSLFGKILRINSDGTIPSDNPFFSTTTGNRRSIWALGLRNPFTFAIQPGTGNMFINDVGEVSWEEVNRGVRGGNYGWPTTEGYTSDSRFVSPLYAYDHSNGCSITGGAFYNPSTPGFPSSYTGDYFFGDYCGGWIRTRDSSTGSIQIFATDLGELVDIRIDSRDGNLYYLSRTGGTLFQVRYTANQMPTIATHPANQTVPVGQTATFSCSASGTAPLNYQWQRNGTNISGATSPSYSIQSVQVSDHGSSYRCLVANAFGNALSNQASLTVISNNTAPTGAVTAPVAGTLFRPGVPINYSGTATDPQDGSLPASAFTWRIDFHHADHVHPFLPETTGSKSGSFVPAAEGHTSRNVFYRITLRVRDSGGLTHTSTRNIHPSPLPVPSTLQIEDAAKATAGTGVPEGWGLNVNGYIEDNFKFPTSGTYTFRVRARGDFGGGAWPILELRVDQVAVASVSVNSAGWATFTLSVPVTSGAHPVALAFANDFSSPSENRNLYLDELSVATTGGGGTSPDGTRLPPASSVIDDLGAVWTIGTSQRILRNGAHASGGLGSHILWYGNTIYVLGTDSSWWSWTGNGWLGRGPNDPAGLTSPDGTRLPPASNIVDNSGAVWTIGTSQRILRNGAHASGGLGSQILWHDDTIYVLGTDGNWWSWSGNGWLGRGPTDSTTFE